MEIIELVDTDGWTYYCVGQVEFLSRERAELFLKEVEYWQQEGKEQTND